MRIEDSTLFETVTPDGAAVTSYVLQRPEGWWLQSFYFTNPSLSADGRYLWCYAMRGPGSPEGKLLAVADLDIGTVRVLPGSRFSDASPMVDPRDGSVYWIGGEGRAQLCRSAPHADAPIEVLNTFPAALIRGRKINRIATHLTFTADRRAVCFDAQIHGEWHAGLLPLDGSPAEIWKRFDVCYNHAQCSPIDPDRMLIAQDFWNDPETGERHVYTHRLWLLDRDGTHRPLFEAPTPRHGHEWWGARGDAVWYVHYDHGVRRYRLADGAVTEHWDGRILHAHCDAAETLLVGDTWGKDGDDKIMGVMAYDIETGADLTIAPPLPLPSPTGHLHPHPQITACGRYIIYTAFTPDGQTSVALTPVAAVKTQLTRAARVEAGTLP